MMILGFLYVAEMVANDRNDGAKEKQLQEKVCETELSEHRVHRLLPIVLESRTLVDLIQAHDSNRLNVSAPFDRSHFVRRRCCLRKRRGGRLLSFHVAHDNGNDW